MIKNFIILAWRNLVRNRSYGIVNIFGLTIGLAVVTIIGLWVWDELSFNKHYKNYDRIAKVLMRYEYAGEVGIGNSMPVPLAEAIRNNCGDHFDEVSLSNEGTYNLTFGEKKFSATGRFVEPGWPRIFSLEMIRGSSTALADPSSIMLSETFASNLFGSDDPIGKVITLTTKFSLRVAGVFRDIPSNNSFATVDFIGAWQFFANSWDWVKNMRDDWDSNAFDIYVLTAGTVGFNAASQKIRNIVEGHIQDDRVKRSLMLYPIDRWHLYEDFDATGANTGGAIQYVWLFGVIGVFVLLLACINFMNLSTARAEKRAREVGIRKTMGSGRSQLIAQFFSESIMASFLSFFLSLILVWLALPAFNDLTAKSIGMPWSNATFWIGSISVCLFTGIVAGSYPAFYLSAFQPVKVLKGLLRSGPSANLPRKVLVVVQFSISIFLIIATVVIYKQIQFAKDRPVGYTRQGLVSIHMTTMEIYSRYTQIQDELLRAGAITGMAQSQCPVTDIWASAGDFEWRGKSEETNDGFNVVAASHDYGSVLGWQFISGRGFDKNRKTDSMGLVLSESAVRFMGLKNPVGEIIKWRGEPYTVLGVIKDVVMTSPFGQNIPVVFPLLKEGGNFVVLRVNPNKPLAESMKTISASFQKNNPFAPFEYTFVNDDYAEKFLNEETIGNLSLLFAALAIFISLLGLFAIASFMAERRTKEVGIRKVLGASLLTLWNLLSRELMLLVLLAILIAVPAGYIAMDGWLTKYDYRFVPSWLIFAVPVLASMLIALLTISIQTIKAAYRNPVKALRSE